MSIPHSPGPLVSPRDPPCDPRHKPCQGSSPNTDTDPNVPRSAICKHARNAALCHGWARREGYTPNPYHVRVAAVRVRVPRSLATPRKHVNVGQLRKWRRTRIALVFLFRMVFVVT